MPSAAICAVPALRNDTFKTDPAGRLKPAAARDQPNAFSLALDAKAIPVIFDLVDPVRNLRDGLGGGRKHKLERGWHTV